MPTKKKSWREKLADDKGLPQVGRIDSRMSQRWGTGTMVIPAPVGVFTGPYRFGLRQNPLAGE